MLRGKQTPRWRSPGLPEFNPYIYICIYIKFCVQKCYAGNRPPCDDHQGYPNLIHIYICIYIKFCVQKCYAGNRPPGDDHQGYPNLIHIYICSCYNVAYNNTLESTVGKLCQDRATTAKRNGFAQMASPQQHRKWHSDKSCTQTTDRGAQQAVPDPCNRLFTHRGSTLLAPRGANSALTPSSQKKMSTRKPWS
jgi:hypothetical protein